MSFRCQGCDISYPNKENPSEYSPKRVVTKTRSYAGDEVARVEIAEEKNLCSLCALVQHGRGPQHVVVPVVPIR